MPAKSMCEQIGEKNQKLHPDHFRERAFASFGAVNEQPGQYPTGPDAAATNSRAASQGFAVIGSPRSALFPFQQHEAGDPEQEYFSDGSVRPSSRAVQAAMFFVISRNSSVYHKGKSVHMKQIGADRRALRGSRASVRKSGDRVQYHSTAHDVSTGSHVLGGTLRPEPHRRIAVQDEITEAIVAAIEPQIYVAENFSQPAQTANKPGRLGSVDEGAVALLADNAQRTMRSRRRCLRRRRRSIRLRPGAWRARTCHMSAFTWGGGP